jgi:probable HAF family extracellular repeat protein
MFPIGRTILVASFLAVIVMSGSVAAQPAKITTALGWSLAVGTSHARTHWPYTLVVPGTLGGPSSYLDEPGIPLTSDGTLIGAADTRTRNNDEQRAFAWHGGKLTDLGVLPGTTGSFVDQVNSHGVGAGGVEKGMNANTPAGDAAVLFEHGRVVDLRTLPGGSHAFAQNIDDQGQVAGYSNNGTRDRFSFFGWRTQTRSFVWQAGKMHDLGSLGGGDTVMNWQNDHGQVVGLSYRNNKPDPANGGNPGLSPFLWQSGHMTDLGTLGGTIGAANWINDKGEVVGQSNLRGDTTTRPFLWRKGHMSNLSSLAAVMPAPTTSRATVISPASPRCPGVQGLMPCSGGTAK